MVDVRAVLDEAMRNSALASWLRTIACGGLQVLAFQWLSFANGQRIDARLVALTPSASLGWVIKTCCAVCVCGARCIYGGVPAR
jgi:hypothetical protein